MTKLEPLLGTMVNEMGAAANAALVLIGDKLGLFRALARQSALTPAELAAKTGTHERYVREWLSAQAASGFVDLRRGDRHVHAVARAGGGVRRRGQPVHYDRRLLFAGRGLRRRAEARPRHSRPARALAGASTATACSAASSGSSGPATSAHLLAEWLPALDGVVDKLERGAKVADVGCGHGASTLHHGRGVPELAVRRHRLPRRARSRTRGSMRRACRNVRFETARAQDYAGVGFDLVDHVRCAARHGRPGRRGAHARRHAEARRHADAGRADGRRQPRRQPQSGRPHLLRLLDQRLRAGLAEPGGRRALGAQAGEKRIGEVVRKGGFTRFRRAAETPFNMVLEARP